MLASNTLFEFIPFLFRMLRIRGSIFGREFGYTVWGFFLFYSEFPGKCRQSSIFLQSHSLIIRRCIIGNTDSSVNLWKTNVFFVLGKQEFRKCETQYSGFAVGERPAVRKNMRNGKNARRGESQKWRAHTLPIIISNSPPLMVFTVSTMIAAFFTDSA